MTDTKKVYDDLIIINLYSRRAFGFQNLVRHTLSPLGPVTMPTGAPVES